MMCGVSFLRSDAAPTQHSLCRQQLCSRDGHSWAGGVTPWRPPAHTCPACAHHQPWTATSTTTPSCCHHSLAAPQPARRRAGFLRADPTPLRPSKKGNHCKDLRLRTHELWDRTVCSPRTSGTLCAPRLPEMTCSGN